MFSWMADELPIADDAHSRGRPVGGSNAFGEHKMSKHQAQKLGHADTALYLVGSVQVGEAPQRLVDGDADYIVYLINMSDGTFVMACYNFNPDGNNNWFAIPHTGRTCAEDCQTCHDGQRWQAILNVDCSETFDLTIATAPDADGRVWGARWQVSPDC